MRMENARKDGTKAAGENKKFWFKVGELYAGWMDVEITVGGESFGFTFDEVDENIWGMMRAYIEIRDYRKNSASLRRDDGHISLFWVGSDLVKIQISPSEGEYFQLYIKAYDIGGEPTILEKTIQLTRTELLEGWDSLFCQMLESEEFPTEFPSYCGLPDGDEDLPEGALGKESRGCVFRKMLETHEMPD